MSSADGRFILISDCVHAYEIYECSGSYALFLLKGGYGAVKWIHTGNDEGLGDENDDILHVPLSAFA